MIRPRSGRALTSPVLILLIVGTVSGPLRAADIGAAVANGNWNAGSSWTGGVVPGSNDNVYIGSLYPTGSVNVSTISLLQNQSAGSVSLGVSGGASGTLNLGTSKLTAANLYLGTSAGSGGTGVVTRGAGGTFAISSQVYVDGINSLTFATGDTTWGLSLTQGAQATTAAAGNVTNSVYIDSGSALKLGAQLNTGSGGTIDVRAGTLNAQGNAIKAGTLFLGWYGEPSTLLNKGALDVGNLYVADRTFDLSSGDTVTAFYLRNATTALPAGVTVSQLNLSTGSVATAAGGSVSNQVSVDASQLAFGGAMSLTGGLYVYNGGTVDLGNHALVTANLYLDGAASALFNRNTLTVTSNLTAAGGHAFTFQSTDTTAGLLVTGSGSTATTAATGNVTASASVSQGGRLTLGAPLNLGSGYLDVQSGTVNAQGRAITAGSIYLGWFGGPAVLQNRGALTATSLYVANQSLNLGTADAVTTFYLHNGSTSLTAGTSVQDLYLSGGSTAAVPAGGVRANADVTASQLTLSGSLSLTGTLGVYNGGGVNFGNHNFAANTLYLSGATSTLSNRGTLTLSNSIYVAGGNVFTFGSADTTSYLDVSGTGSAVTTAAVGNVGSSVYVDGGGSLTLGAPLNLGTGNLDVRAGTLNAQGRPITAGTVALGWHGGPTVFQNKGVLTATNLYVGGLTLNLATGDSVTHLALNNASSTFASGQSVQTLSLSGGSTATVGAGGVTGSATVGASQLAVGGPLTLTGTLGVSGGGSVNFGGHALTANDLSLDGAATTLVNRGALTIASYVTVSGGHAFTFGPADTAAGLSVSGAGSGVTTSAVGNVSSQVYVGPGSLTLGAPLNISGSLDAREGAVVNAQGRPITASNVYVGTFSSANGTQLQNAGSVTAAVLSLGKQSQGRLVTGESVVGSVSVYGNSTLTVSHAVPGDAQLTITGTGASALDIEGGSKLSFQLNGAKQTIVLKWANPTGSDHVADLNALIAANKIDFTYVNGATHMISSDGNFTYLFQPVPEPGAVLAIGIGAVGVFAGVRRTRRTRQPVG